MKTDIYQKIAKDFGARMHEVIELIDILDAQTKGLINDRIIRSILFLAEGNVERFKELITLSKKDYRDLLWQAEYDCGEKRIYDFHKSFHELNLIDK